MRLIPKGGEGTIKSSYRLVARLSLCGRFHESVLLEEVSPLDFTNILILGQQNFPGRLDLADIARDGFSVAPGHSYREVVIRPSTDTFSAEGAKIRECMLINQES